MSEYPFQPGMKIFGFQPEVKGMCISNKQKKNHPGLKFHLAVNFALPTCNMPLIKDENTLCKTIPNGSCYYSS